MGAAGDRHDPRLHRHGRRPADRRLPSTRPVGSAPPWSATSGAASGPTWSARSSASLLAAAVYRFVLEAGGTAADRTAGARAPAGPETVDPDQRQTRQLGRNTFKGAIPTGVAPFLCPCPGGTCSSLSGVRRVTFSRNFTLSLSPDLPVLLQVLRLRHASGAHPRAGRGREATGRGAVRRNAKELLVLTGERPEVNPMVAERLTTWGHDDFTSYVVWACERALERGMLPHTNLGVLDKRDLARLREVTASQGLMLESTSERLMETVHAGSPTKHPAARLATIEAAGELKIPFTSGILVGIGETLRRAHRISRSPCDQSRSPRPSPRGDPPKLRSAPAVLRSRGGGDRG